jgi:hypothetical protein
MDVWWERGEEPVATSWPRVYIVPRWRKKAVKMKKRKRVR